MTELSPAAQAIWDAWWNANNRYAIQDLGVIVRAAADQVLAVQWEGRIEPDAAHSLGINWTRDALHAIAAELEGGND